MRTLAAPNGDLDFQIVDGLPSLQQRLVQKLQFGRGEWFLDTSLGVPYIHEALGRTDPVLSQQVITSQILADDEVTEVSDVTYEVADAAKRRYKYTANVHSEFGLISLEVIV